MKPHNLVAFKEVCLQKQSTLTTRQRQAADYVINHPNDIAFNSLTDIAKLSKIAPAMFVRLAQSLDFTGFSEMQKIFREPLIEKSTPSYSELIRHHQGSEAVTDPSDNNTIVQAFGRANKVSLDYLCEHTDDLHIDKAVEMILSAEHVYTLGLRRSFPLASYLGYAFSRLKIRNTLITGLGGITEDQFEIAGKNDLLIAMSFPPYAEATLKLCHDAKDRGIPSLIITDNSMGPFAKDASCIIEVQDAVLHGFRSLTASMSLIQSIVIAIAYRKQNSGESISLDTIDC